MVRMSSLETYNKLRGEIDQIFKEGDNLVEGDEFWLDLISDSMKPKKVLEIAKEMKEKGNTFFNSKEFENALEMYGYGLTILARYKFEEANDRAEFCDLALCMMLNSTACFNKLKEFVQVGQICSIILEFQPENIKAMYRRAIAAIELGRYDMAYWDLVVAAKLDPNNREVVKKLEEVKNCIKLKKSKDQVQGECPKGLGLGLPPPTKKPEHEVRKIHTLNQDEFKKMDSTIIDKEENTGEIVVDTKDQDEFKEMDSTMTDKDDDKGEIIVDHKGKDDLIINNKHMEECQKISEDISPTLLMQGRREEIKEEMMEDNSSIAEEDDQLSCVCNTEVNETMIFEEPKYRFHNSRKHGSNITLSRSDYLLLTERKTLRYYNAKSGSYMEVRIRNSPAKTPNANNGDHKQHELYSMTSGEQPSIKKEQDKDDSMEEYSEAHSCVTSDDDHGSYETSSYCPRNGDGSPFHTKKHALFCFSAYPKNAVRRKRYSARMKTNKSPSFTLKRNNKRKTLHSDSVPSFSVNLYCGCRFVQDRKRKSAHPVPVDSYYPLRKRGRYNPPPVCSTESTYCTNVGDVTSIGYCHELPYSNVSCIRMECREQVGTTHGGRT